MKTDDETIEKWYEAVNTLNPEVDGITLDDHNKMMEIGRAFTAKIMGEKKEWLLKKFVTKNILISTMDLNFIHIIKY